MPFDGTNVFRPDMRVASLEGLSWRLRHKETWPEGFEWNYAVCGMCAIGLARSLWMLPINFLAHASRNMAAGFQIPEDVAFRIFINLEGNEGFFFGRRSSITPEHVADAIDEYLKESVHAV